MGQCPKCGTKTEFRDAQDALAPILDRLAGPLELRLLPASTRGNSG